MSEPRRRGEVVSTRFTAEEVAEIDRIAAEHGRSRAEMTRDLVLTSMLRMRPGVEVKRLPSGAELTVWPGIPSALPVTSATSTNGVA